MFFSWPDKKVKFNKETRTMCGKVWDMWCMPIKKTHFDIFTAIAMGMMTFF